MIHHTVTKRYTNYCVIPINDKYMIILCTKRTGWFVHIAQYIYIYIYMLCVKLEFEPFEDFVAQNVDQGFVQQSEDCAYNPWTYNCKVRIYNINGYSSWTTHADANSRIPS